MRNAALLVLLCMLLLVLCSPCSRCQDDDTSSGGSTSDDDDEYSQGDSDNPEVVPLFSQLIYKRFSNLTGIFAHEIGEHLGYCVKDVDADWNGAFNFSSDLGFVANCVRKTRGDLSQRICTAAEAKFYFNSFFDGGHGSGTANYLKPNKNCNLTSWPEGCEPGWACKTPPGSKVDLRNSKDVPLRTLDAACPLGAYCPLAKLNKTTGVCDPYLYQLPPGKANHTCGGADKWSDVLTNGEVFCSGGSYCPSTIQKIPCSSGYCLLPQKFCKYTTVGWDPQVKKVKEATATWVAALSTLLVIIYNCSDQVLTTRERQQAKSREAAARSARETAQARERWKAAKDTAKKHAIGLQSQLSRTFSRKKSVRKPEQMKVLGSKGGSGDSLLPPMGSSPNPSGSSASKHKEPSNLTKMMRALEDDPESNEGFNLEIGDKNLKKHMPKGKQMHTRSQIFKYAYGQIEKEKAQQQQNKNLTFSGVISMATETEIRTRPVIEVAFKDLTLTLKGKNKHLLRCVTGKILPGRVSAVMGPSGAGKTTFLSALAGKVAGCRMSGLILINGKVESIHSYKRIIGFVPQDDIVHGNLTVEENLWFSARCRLAADLPKPDKVLVVERVIESLGLQAVRDSLVGTVEKRGISGGQRKRVNVGLEMVMEPSLLILDEPTSGLDSSSSQLLLRALRREALEGVNICMVVHQPR
ncbi:ABC transporter G member 28 [Asimina triloba]